MRLLIEIFCYLIIFLVIGIVTQLNTKEDIIIKIIGIITAGTLAYIVKSFLIKLRL